LQYWNRVLVGSFLLALTFAANYYGAILWAFLVLIFYLLAFHELKNLCANMGIYPLVNWINFFIALFILSPIFVNKFMPSYYSTCALQIGLIVSAYVIIFPKILLNKFTKFEDLTTSLWAIFHLGLLASFFTWLRLLDHGMLYTFALIITAAANDIGALLFGKLFGKEKLAPQISPGKTVAGSIGGLLSGSIAFYLLFVNFSFKFRPDFLLVIEEATKYLPNMDVERFLILLIGLALALLGQIGDLLVSALKRAAGVKDSGNLLLSHGGVLDRIDGISFMVWLAFWVFTYLIY